MIELFEGVPGAGKSYYAIAERFLVHLRAGRRIYAYIDGIYLDKLALFSGIERADLDKQVTVWRTQEDVLLNLASVDPMSFVIIDEAQTVFRAMERVDKALCRFLETHRHHGVDILMMCQDYRQMSQSVTRLVEGTIKFRKLAFVGLTNHYQGKVRGNPDDPTEIRKITGTYDPGVYAYYSSYSAATVKELRMSNSVWKSASVVVGGVSLLFALFVFLWRPWTSLADPANPAAPAPSPTSKPLNPTGPGSLGSHATHAPASKVVIIGSGGRKGKYYYFLEDGRMFTAQDIASKFGVAVHEVKDGAFYRLVGEGVQYGPSGD
ncbi:MAG: Zonular occludens toxin (Zot) [Nitrospira sp. OLB3]|nr:MAG: Zonular occludens toxin (Zot) [Nitrospira sp. OLB3]